MSGRPAATTFLVTGGAGFIGSALCRRLIRRPQTRVVNVDKLTYAANPSALDGRAANYWFHEADIADDVRMLDLLRGKRVDVVIHLAAETHVDRSIAAPARFIETNVVGTLHLLNAVLAYWRELPPARQEHFRFHHVSTDEVYGSLPLGAGRFTEDSPYAPSSPYAASKAAADHLVLAWHRTHGLPVVLTHSSNNYGPRQFPEKLIPLTILSAVEEQPIPIYGDGQNVRDWLFVDDHARALELVALGGEIGQSYNIGGGMERSNLDVVTAICDVLDRVRPRRNGRSYREIITFVPDRPGHDRRYALDSAKIERMLGWRPSVSFEEGLVRTVEWYLANEERWRPRWRARPHRAAGQAAMSAT